MASRSIYRLGALALAVVCLAGWIALLGAPSAAVGASPAPAPHTRALASGRPAEAVAYAGPAVVRVLTYYYGTTSNSGPIPVPVACAGAGALVGTTPSNSFNYVVTATSVVNPQTPCQGVQAAFQQLNGVASQSWGLERIVVTLGAAYTGTAAQHLGAITYTVDPSVIVTTGGPFSPKLVTLPLTPASGAPSHDLPVLTPPQPSDPPAGTDQTVVDLGTADGQLIARDALTTSEISDTLTPVTFAAAQLNQEIVPAATKPPTPTPQYATVVGGTPLPVHTPATGGQPTTTASVYADAVSAGAPVINDNGALVGMVIVSGNTHVITPLAQVVQGIGAVSGKRGPLMTGWSQGLTSFYASPADFAGATTAFTTLTTSDPDFAGVGAYLTAAEHKTTAVAGSVPSPVPTTTATSPGSGFLSRYGSLLIVGVVGVLVLLLLLAVAYLFLRRRGDRPGPGGRPMGSAPPSRPVRGPGGAPSGPAADVAFARPAAPSRPAPSAWSSPVGSPPVGSPPVGSPLAGGPVSSRPMGAPAPGSVPLGATIENAQTERMPAAASVGAVTIGRGANLVPQASGLTDPGRKRAGGPNQDNILAITGMRLMNGRPQSYGLFIVTDGMGGHTHGNDASRLTIEIVSGHVVPALTSGQPLDGDALTTLLREGITHANAELRNLNLNKGGDMGTTITAALVVGDVAHVANCGDSRTYLLNPESGLSRITTDHSVVASLASAGVIQPDDVYTHPRRNQIYRSLGGQHEDSAVDFFHVPLQAGDRLLLCSDGLWEMIRDPEIDNILRTNADPRQATQVLVREANNNGGEDNISVIVVRMLDDPTAHPAQPGMRVVAGP